VLLAPFNCFGSKQQIKVEVARPDVITKTSLYGNNMQPVDKKPSHNHSQGQTQLILFRFYSCCGRLNELSLFYEPLCIPVKHLLEGGCFCLFKKG